MVTDRITSLPIVVADRKSIFEDSGLEVDIRTGVDYKSIIALLEAGRIDVAELPTIAYLYNCYLKKSKAKRIYKGIYLSHSPMNFFSRAYFKPHHVLLNKTYDVPVPSQLSPERFFTERFIEKYFPEKYPKMRFVETPYYLFEKHIRSRSSLGCTGDSFFCPFLNKFHSFDETAKEILPELAGEYIPSTMLVFSGQFVKKFASSTEKILRGVQKSIEFLNSCNQDSIDDLLSNTNILTFYPHFRYGEVKQLLLQNSLKKKKLFHWRGDSRLLGLLIEDHFFQGIRRTITPDDVQSTMNFTEIWEALESPNQKIHKLNSFLNPVAEIQYPATPPGHKQLNYTRGLVTDTISISLDVLEGNIHSRLHIDNSTTLDNQVRIHLNNMLDYYQAELFKLSERIIELENFNSILEIKLDRNSVNLQYSEERYRYLFEFSREALIIVDTDSGEIIESNLQFRLMTGYSRTDLSRIKLDDVIVSQKLEKEFFLGTPKDDSMLNIPDGEIILKDGSRLGVDISINSMLVSPKKRYQIILRDNRERVESEKAKHEFISNISHELRSPMTNIRGYFELLTEDPLIRTKPENAEMLDIIDKNIKRLSFLIENLLKIEKEIRENEDDGNSEMFDPAIVAEDVIHMNSHLFQEKNLHVIANLEKGHRVKGIRFEFSQIVSNLFVNAIKYTPAGEIRISIMPNNGKIELIVSDTGMGIPEKYKNTIFDRFFRIPSPENKKIGGTGLGLSITKSLVEKMGGEISFESEVGKGTIFKVEVKHIS